MARDKSAVLSAADRRAVKANVRQQLVSAKAAVNVVNAEVKLADKMLKEATKHHTARMKKLNKDLVVATKALAKLDAEYKALSV